MHVVAACIWIGGQLTVAAIIPMVRDHRDLARRMGRRYQAVAWPAFAVLIVTGVVNIGNAGLRWSQLLDSAAGRTLLIKCFSLHSRGSLRGCTPFSRRRGVSVQPAVRLSDQQYSDRSASSQLFSLLSMALR